MKVKKAEYVEDYKIKIVFSNGVTKIVNFASFLKNAKHVFIPLKNLSYFKEYQVDDITLSWPNGADFDPELLYAMGTAVMPRKQCLKPRTRRKISVKIAAKRIRSKK